MVSHAPARGQEQCASAVRPRRPKSGRLIEEALRLYPPIVAISRAAHEAEERPDVFDPTRFLEAARERIDRFAYLPFGVGPRVCIGAAFALHEATLGLLMAYWSAAAPPRAPRRRIRMAILGRNVETWQLLNVINDLEARISSLERGWQEPGDVRTISVGDASLVMKKDGTIELRGKDITIRASGRIDIRAAGDLALKGSKTIQN
jgi:Cytochrome P450